MLAGEARVGTAKTAPDTPRVWTYNPFVLCQLSLEYRAAPRLS